VADSRVNSPLRALSACLLQLADLARQAQPQDMLLSALQILRTLVAFDTAWWGEVSAGIGPAAPRNWVHGSIGLSKDFAQEWNALSTVDEFALESIAQLGVVIRHSAADDPSPAPPAVEAFCQRHGLFHCMAITVELPDSGLMFFVAVYRTQARPMFSDEDAVLFGEFVSHLLFHWRQMLERLKKAPMSRPWDSYALADLDGGLLFMGLRVGQALDAAYPDWSGTALPPELSQALCNVPGRFVSGKSCRLRLEPCGALVLISIASRQHKPALAPRELSAAMLYAHGHSHKDIAAALKLTPATVRTYLRSAYSALGVRNKLELVAALHRA
jgi:DNA-binding CsgD family transcriptional regulator